MAFVNITLFISELGICIPWWETTPDMVLTYMCGDVVWRFHSDFVGLPCHVQKLDFDEIQSSHILLNASYPKTGNLHRKKSINTFKRNKNRFHNRSFFTSVCLWPLSSVQTYILKAKWQRLFKTWFQKGTPICESSTFNSYHFDIHWRSLRFKMLYYAIGPS